ncbi:acyl-CoA dehydrogenase family protein [Gordonia sp. NB41Y]|nr:acyl-CoA dehydrogenase family protein [Gordonia sp. NB41Y]WLP93091.1 acyl-CoA dehydrogenase family protein [Gordonia sp. NB41Y]
MKKRSRNFSHGDTAVPLDEAVIQQQVGTISAHANTARALVLDAARAIEIANEATGAPEWERLVDVAVLRTSQVKIALDRSALEASSGIFEVGGASAASQEVNLDRHWRNIRTLTLHNPTSYKAVAVGRYLSTGAPFPDNGFF